MVDREAAIDLHFANKLSVRKKVRRIGGGRRRGKEESFFFERKRPFSDAEGLFHILRIFAAQIYIYFIAVPFSLLPGKNGDSCDCLRDGLWIISTLAIRVARFIA